MKSVWKWVISIVVVLLVLGAIVAVPFVMHSSFGPQTGFGLRERGFEGGYGPSGMMGRGNEDGFGYQGGPGGFQRGGMMGRGYGFHHPMMYGFGFFPFGFFMWIIPLAVLGLAIYGLIALIKQRPASTVPAEVTPSAPTQPCGNCGKPAQADWKTCPYCGHSL